MSSEVKSKASQVYIADGQPLSRGTSALEENAMNPTGRFERLTLSVDDYVHRTVEDEERPLPRTQFLKDSSRTIISKNESPDISFEASINPYRGCEHGCIYCYARPTHEYLGMSAGLDFESKILVKHDAALLLREKLMKKSWEPKIIHISGVTDCYQPIERKLKITRSIVEVLGEFKNPFTMITKNHLITRDIDLFKPMAELNAVGLLISLTSLNPEITARMEPRTSRPAFRLKAIEALARAGIPVGVNIAPVVPGLTDHEMPELLRAAANAGAHFAGYTALRLPYGLGPLFEAWISTHFPERKDKVLNRIREMRGGKLNDPNFKSRMRGSGFFADHLSTLFELYRKKFGLNRIRLNLTTEHFQRPEAYGQMTLF